MAFLASTPKRKQLQIILALRYEAVSRKRSEPTGSTPVSAETNKVLNEFVDGLTASDEHIRHQAVASVLAVSPEITRRMVADRLVDLLGSKDKELRRRAAASLAELGGAVKANLVLGLLKTQDEIVRDRLIGSLTRIALTMPGTEVSRLIVDALIAALSGPVLRSRRQRSRRPRRPETA
jgi:HEAT repeat protein